MGASRGGAGPAGSVAATAAGAGGPSESADAAAGAGGKSATDDEDSADDGVKRVRKKAKKNAVWGHCTETTTPYKAGQPSYKSFCNYCHNNGVHVILNGRAETLTTHLLECMYVPQDVKRDLGKGKRRRPHRAKSAVDEPLNTVVTRSGPIDAFRTAKPMGIKEQTDFSEHLLRVLITCNISFNCMQSPAMVGLLLRWVPGLQRVPSRGDMSGKLL